MSKASHILKAWLLCTCQFYFLALPFSWLYRFNQRWHRSNWSNTISLIRVNTVCYVCKDISTKTAWCGYYGQFYKTTFTVVNSLNIINYICDFIVNHPFSVISLFEMFTDILSIETLKSGIILDQNYVGSLKWAMVHISFKSVHANYII